jgi:hypothetical protein
MSSFSAVNPAEMQSSVNKVLQGTSLTDLLKAGGQRIRPAAVGALGGRIWKLIQDALGNIDLSGMTKEQFLDKVDALYDSMIAPAIIGINPVIGPILNAALNQVILNIAGKFYDNHSEPKPTPTPTSAE